MSLLEQENLTGKNPEGINANTPLKYLTATSIIGDKVKNKDGEHMGEIENLMVDVTSGKIEYVLIKFGGFLTINEKDFAIPFSQLQVDSENKCFILDKSKDFMEKAPGFDINHWPETNFHAEEKYWSFL